MTLEKSKSKKSLGKSLSQSKSMIVSSKNTKSRKQQKQTTKDIESEIARIHERRRTNIKDAGGGGGGGGGEEIEKNEFFHRIQESAQRSKCASRIMIYSWVQP